MSFAASTHLRIAALCLAGTFASAHAAAETPSYTEPYWNLPDVQPDIQPASEIISDVEPELPWKGDPDWANWPFQSACWAESCADWAELCAQTWGCKELLVCAKWGEQTCEGEPASWTAESTALKLLQCGEALCHPANASSCQYRCGKWTSLSGACQCDPGCTFRGDCCADRPKYCPVKKDTEQADNDTSIDPPDSGWPGDATTLAETGSSPVDTAAKSSTPSAADGCGAGRTAAQVWPAAAVLVAWVRRRMLCWAQERST